MQPFSLVASLGKRGVAIECDRVDGRTELYGVPAAVSHFWKCRPPVFQRCIRIAVELMVAQRRIHAKLLVAPDFCLLAVDRVIIGHIAAVWNVSAHQYGGG